jgi:hypothetical protein
MAGLICLILICVQISTTGEHYRNPRHLFTRNFLKTYILKFMALFLGIVNLIKLVDHEKLIYCLERDPYLFSF